MMQINDTVARGGSLQAEAHAAAFLKLAYAVQKSQDCSECTL